MAKEICVSSTPHETRLAILEDEQLTEVYYERENEYTLAGSIYKGRVTRVLPGMQSAFVDLGLERDAFLYVTDFMEEQEDSSDFERLPANGKGDEPRENREPREARGPRPAQAATSGEEETRRNGAPSGQQSEGEFEDGTRRWRGRRGRRRGFRPPQGDRENQPQREQPSHREQQPVARPEPVFETPATIEAPVAPVFALPGESLSKYGGQPASRPAAPAADNRAPQLKPTAITSRPSTLVEVPLSWDGAGPLPGESLSRYRGPAPVQEAPAVLESAQAHPIVFDEEQSSAVHEIAHEPAPETFAHFEPELAHPEVSAEIEPEEESRVEIEEKAVLSSMADEPTLSPVEFEPEEASASYRIDPAAPSEFRFSAPTVEEEQVDEEHVQEERGHEPEIHAAPEPEPEQVEETTEFMAASSTGIADLDLDFDEPEEDLSGPETGLVEEEEITEEEYEFTPLYVESEDHDLQDLEEETLDREVAAGGELGEMVRDAHIEQRVEGHNGSLVIDEEEGEDEFDTVDETESEEEPVAAVPGQQPRRRDDNRRGGRRNDGRRRHNGRRPNAQTSDLPIISELLKQGQEILVQIAKEPIAKKGARITSHIALPGRFLVFMPTVNHVGVSRKISSDEERQRLKRILISEKGTVTGGFIVRTAADGASEDDLRADIRFLISLWTEIKQRSDSAKAPALIYHDLNLVERILRDQVSDNFSTIWVDTEAEYERIVRFLNRFQPSLVRRVKLYTKETPLFEQFGIQDEISKALKSKVWLKSGGSIVINQTEALVAIDINTGKYVGKTARLEDTILKTNLDAIPEIVRQIRLRDLGGIIVIDFIDMDERKNRNKVMQALEEELKNDRAPSKVLQFNDFGLVAITRKRVKQSLERTLSTQCAVCAGTGMVKSPTTVCNEIYVEMRKMQAHLERQDVLLRVHPEVVKTLKLGNARWLNELEEMSGKTIIVKSDPTLHPEQFDIH
jgi:ribonuclease G